MGCWRPRAPRALQLNYSPSLCLHVCFSHTKYSSPHTNYWLKDQTVEVAAEETLRLSQVTCHKWSYRFLLQDLFPTEHSPQQRAGRRPPSSLRSPEGLLAAVSGGTESSHWEGFSKKDELGEGLNWVVQECKSILLLPTPQCWACWDCVVYIYREEKSHPQAFPATRQQGMHISSLHPVAYTSRMYFEWFLTVATTDPVCRHLTVCCHKYVLSC